MSSAPAVPTRRMKIAIFGPVSSGKSSLINALIGLPLAEVKATPTTKCICTFVRGELKGKNAINALAEAKSEIEFYNKYPSSLQYKPVTIKGIIEGKANPRLIKNNATLVDLPGYNDSFTVKRAGLMPNFLREPLFKQLCDEVEKSSVTIFLLPPNLINDEETLGKIVLMGSKNTNILVVLSRADEYCKANGEIDVDLIGATTSMTEERTGLPVVAMSVHKSHPLLSVEKIFDIVENLAAYKPTKHRQKEQILDQMKQRSFIPIKLLQHITEEEKKNTTSGYRKAAIGTAAVGGLGVGVAGALIAGGVLLGVIIPGLGTGVGAVAITSGLAAFGGTMAGGLAAVAGITASAGLVGALVGSAAAAGLTVGTGAIHAKRCLGSRMAKLIINSEDDSIQIHYVTKEQFQGLKEASQESSNTRYLTLKEEIYPKHYSDEFLYFDSVIVELKTKTKDLGEGLYLVSGVFEKANLVALQTCMKIEAGTSEQLQRQQEQIEKVKNPAPQKPKPTSESDLFQEEKTEEFKRLLQDLLAEDQDEGSTTKSQKISAASASVQQKAAAAQRSSEPFNLRIWLIDTIGVVPDIDEVCDAFEEEEFYTEESIASMNESDVNRMAQAKGWKRGRIPKLYAAIKKLRERVGVNELMQL